MVFDTKDVVALYLGKVFSYNQMPKIKDVVEFLVGDGKTFTYNDTPRLLSLQQALVKQLPWLGSVRYNRKGLEDMIKNLIRNHGSTLEVTR